jgi:ubiquinone/menaquinone biosynthesis C-methylase UbiE
MTDHPPIVSFDRIARLYRWMEYLTFGPSLQRCRQHFLSRLTNSTHALILGDGDGRFTARLLAANPTIHIDAVDSSAAMLFQLQRRAATIGALARLRTHHTDALRFIPTGSFDLVVTHFFLDCLDQRQIDQLCAQLAPHLQPQALWLVAEFRIPSGAMHLPARALVRGLYRAFRLLTGLRTRTLPDYASALTAAGFVLAAQHLSLGGLLTTEVWQREEYTPAMLPPQNPRTGSVPDPLPNPEPASPSLPDPDPGVFHHEPGVPSATPPGSPKSEGHS